MPTETIYADSSVTGNCTTPDNATGAPNGTYTTDSGNTSWTHTWHLPAPVTNPRGAGTQTVNVRVRKSGGSNDPSITSVRAYIDLGGGTWQGPFTVSGTYGSVTSTTGQDFSGTFDDTIWGTWSAVSNDIRVEIITSGAGGSPSSRSAVQLDAITWTATTTTAVSVSAGTALMGVESGDLAELSPKIRVRAGRVGRP